METIAAAALSSGGTLFFVLFLLFKYPDAVKKWISNIAWLLSRLYKRYEYIAIKNEIEGKLNSFIGDLSLQTTIDFPTVTVRWTGIDEKEEIIYEDFEAVIVMRDRKYKSRNFVHAAYFFVSETLLRKAKNHLSPSIKKSLDLFATKNVLEKESVGSVEQFINDYLNPEIEKSEAVKNFIKQFNNINRFGLFFPILIQELTTLGNKTLLSDTNQDVITEVKNLINFLEEWSKREVGNNETPEAFFGNYMRCSIKIVATVYTREAGKIIAQRDRILEECKKGCENIYIVGNARKESRQFMNNVVNKTLEANKNLQLIRSIKFPAEITIKGEKRQITDYFLHLHDPNSVKHLYE